MLVTCVADGQVTWNMVMVADRTFGISKSMWYRLRSHLEKTYF